jgi:GntR family transcriptional regulator
LRKAIELLASEGLIERFQGRGTFVRRINFDSSLFRFFRMERAAGERIIPKSLILKRELTRAPAVVARALRLDPGAMVIRMKRTRTIEERIVLLEEIWLPYQPFQRFFTLDLSEIGDLLYPEYERQAGQIVASAEETLTVDVVRESEARVLRLKVGTPLIVIERVARGYDGSPIEWRRSRGPATHFRYKVEIR